LEGKMQRRTGSHGCCCVVYFSEPPIKAAVFGVQARGSMDGH
jgi:hypothetical protein